MNAWDLGTISGIRIRVHWTFLLLPIYIYFSSLFAGSGTVAAVISLLFVLAIFGCVVLHELGHALAARQFGIATRDITLLPIGGVAALERMPQKPWQELWIAVAGPLVNVVIASVLFAGLTVSGGIGAGGIATGFLMQLAFANVVLVVFNMIPAFPMDGGRVLRSTLAMFLDYVSATRIAVTVGKVMAVSLGLFGLMSGNLMLLLVAAFVYLAAHAEKIQVVSRAGGPVAPPQPMENWNRFNDASTPAASAGIWFNEPRESNEVSVPSTLNVSSVAAWLNNRHADVCSVIDADRVLGRITRSRVIAACAQGLGNVPIGRLL